MLLAKYRNIFYLFLIVLIVRIFVFFLIPDNFDLYDSEPWSKIHIALQWQESGRLLPDINFAPLHAYFIIAGLEIWNNVSVTPRLISLIFGIFFIFPFYGLIRKLFDDRVALISGILLAFYPLHARLSVLSLAMVPFVFCLFLSLYCFFVYKENKKLQYLIYSGIFLNFAGALRYEGWIFIPILLLFLIRENKKHLLIFVLIVLIIPSLIMVISYKMFDNPVNFAYISTQVHKHLLSSLQLNHIVFGWIISLKQVFYTTILLISAIGIVYSIFSKKRFYHYFALIFFALFIVYEYRLLNRHFTFHIRRYVLPMSLLIFPYISVGILSCGKIIKNEKIKRFVILIIVSTIVFFWSKKIILDSLNSQPPIELKECTELLGKYIKPQDTILLDSLVNYHPYVIINSGLKIEQFLNCQYKPSGKIIEKSFYNILDKEPDFVFYSFKSGRLKEILSFDSDNSVEWFKNLKFITIFSSGEYRIYRISYN